MWKVEAHHEEINVIKDSMFHIPSTGDSKLLANEKKV